MPWRLPFGGVQKPPVTQLQERPCRVLAFALHHADILGDRLYNFLFRRREVRQVKSGALRDEGAAKVGRAAADGIADFVIERVPLARVLLELREPLNAPDAPDNAGNPLVHSL